MIEIVLWFVIANIRVSFVIFDRRFPSLFVISHCVYDENFIALLESKIEQRKSLHFQCTSVNIADKTVTRPEIRRNWNWFGVDRETVNLRLIDISAKQVRLQELIPINPKPIASLRLKLIGLEIDASTGTIKFPCVWILFEKKVHYCQSRETFCLSRLCSRKKQRNQILSVIMPIWLTRTAAAAAVVVDSGELFNVAKPRKLVDFYTSEEKSWPSDQSQYEDVEQIK